MAVRGGDSHFSDDLRVDIGGPPGRGRNGKALSRAGPDLREIPADVDRVSRSSDVIDAARVGHCPQLWVDRLSDRLPGAKRKERGH
jgi:hypothetical protein